MDCIPVKVSSSLPTIPVLAYSTNTTQKVNVKTLIDVNFYNGEIYEGEYIVAPKFKTETILETKYKKMEDDVQVLKIPYYETISPSSIGYTIIIDTDEEGV